MKHNVLLTLSFLLYSSLPAFAQDTNYKKALVNYSTYEKLVEEVSTHRKDRLVSFNRFIEMSRDPNTIIIDTRSDSMYKARHIKGAVHLNFSDFNEESLRRIIPGKNTRILIYCNNNISRDPDFFRSKGVRPARPGAEEILLALNVPTFINLYGYGYTNIYELDELVDIFDQRLELEGTNVLRMNWGNETLKKQEDLPTD